MAEQTNGSTGMQKAAEGALLQLVARYGIIGICAIALPVGAWVGNRLVSQMDKVADRVEGLTTDMAVVKTDIRYLRRKIDP